MSVKAAPRPRDIHVTVLARVSIAAALGVAIFAVELSVRSDSGLREQVLAQLLAFALFLPAAWLC